MGGEKKGVKRFKKGMAKATKKFGEGHAQYNKGARTKPREQEKEMEDMEVLDTVMQVKKHSKPAAQKPKSSAKASSKTKGDTVKQHQEELAKLEEMDPTFFDFLKQNDASLLDFGNAGSDDSDEDGEEGEEDDDEEEDDVEEGEGDEHGSDSEQEEREEKPLIPVTEQLLKTTVAAAQKGNLAAFKRLLAIFRAACVPNGKGEQTSDNLGDDDEKQVVSRYLVPSAEIYQLTMYTVLEEAHTAFYVLLGLKSDKLDRTQLETLSKHPKWKRMQLLVLSFFKSYMTVLGSVARGSASASDSDAENSPAEVAVYLMQAIAPYVPLLTPLPRLSKALLKIFLYVWAEGPDPTTDTQALRARAYLRIRQMAMQLPGAYAEECFRCLYLTYTRVCKTFTEYNGAGVTFMVRCVVELYQTDVLQAYQQCFLYVRQLALHLRTAVLKKTSDNVRQVTSWQFLNCLRLWTRVVCSMPAEDELGALAFPLSQVMYGVMAIAQSVYLLPLRFHCIGCLQLLASHCQMFIPTAQKLLEVLELPELLQAKATPSTETPPRLQFLVKFPTDSVTRAPVRDAIVLECITLLRHDAEVYRHHVGFPEYAYLTTRKLRAFAKAAKVSKWRDMARTTATQIESCVSEAKKGRAKLQQSPADVKEFEPLLKGDAPNSARRLVKLLGGRGGYSAATEITVPSTADALKARVAAKAASAKQAKAMPAMDSGDDDESSGEEDEEEEEEEEEEDDEESEIEEEVVVKKRSNGKNGKAQKVDQTRKMDVDSFFD